MTKSKWDGLGLGLILVSMAALIIGVVWVLYG